MGYLADWLESKRETQRWLMRQLGEDSPSKINSWVSGKYAVPKEHEAKLKKLGYTGPLKEPEQDTLRILPEHVSDAWAILHDACHASNAQPMRVDVKAFGRLLAVVAEKLSQGKGESVKLELQEMARDFVGAMGKAQR